MIDALFVSQRVRMKHLAAPLLKEREEYLGHLLGLGFSSSTLQKVATLLLHIIRVMDLTKLRCVSEAEIKEAGLRWASEENPFRVGRVNKSSAYKFFSRARSWLRFHRVLAVLKPAEFWFDTHLQDFILEMRGIGLTPWTIVEYASQIKAFFNWLVARRYCISSITIQDIDDYIDERRTSGLSPRGLVADCAPLRKFFTFAEARGWCRWGFARGIRNPVRIKYDAAPGGPAWKDVRRMIRAADGIKPADYRAKAILLLCAIYGLRSREVTHLSLADFDWRNEIFTVRRAKGGRTQQFPIQYEVGEALIQYLKLGRPQCQCRNLFLPLHAPYRPLGVIWKVVSRRMKKLGITSKHYGAHSLRHACATELLRKGTSLQDIADFLGHRSVESVTVYAKHDARSLRKVANIRLAGVL